MKKPVPTKTRGSKRNLKEKGVNVDKSCFQVETLSLFDRVFLGAILTEGWDSKHNAIKPLCGLYHPIMPNEELLIRTLERLLDTNVLLTFEPLGLPVELHPKHTNVYSKSHLNSSMHEALNSWYLLNTEPKERLNVILGLTKFATAFVTDKDDVVELWRSLSAWECIEYLDYKISELFHSSPLNKEWMFSIMHEHVKSLSQAQIFKTIESAVFHAYSYANQKGLTKTRGAENSITTYQIFASNAIEKDGWFKRGFDERPKDAPICLMMHFMAQSYLNIEDEGFHWIFDMEQPK